MKLVLLTFLLLYAKATQAQNQVIDSLLHQLALTKQDTSRVLTLVGLSRQFRFARANESMSYGQQALTLARQIQFLRGECLALAEIGNIYRYLGNLPKSLEVLLKALNLAEENHYLAEMARCNSRIGNIYNDLKDYKKAIIYGRKSLQIAQQIENQEQIAIQFLNIGAIYVLVNQVDSAEHYLPLAYQYITRLKLATLYPNILRNLGRLQDKLRNYPLALSYYQQSIQTALAANDHSNAAFNYNELAAFYQRAHQPDSCIAYARKGLDQAQAGPFDIRILEASGLLADAYKHKQDFRQAFVYEELVLKTKERLFGAGSIQALQTMIANEEKRQQEIVRAKEAYQNQIRQYTLLTGLAVFLLIALILYRNNQQKQKANRLLHQQKEEIDHQRYKAEAALSELKTTQTQLIQREKMASLGELTAGIAHEIQNPLNFVNNFSELSVELIQEQKETLAKGDVQEAQLIANDLTQNLEKITLHGQRASGIVKGMLEHARTSTGQKEPTDLNTLADEYLRLAYQGQHSKGQSFTCELITDFAPDLPPVNVVPQEMGRVLLNLYNNAFYAVSQKQKTVSSDYQPTVTVSTAFVNGSVEIRVKDNGSGIPEVVKAKVFQPFFTTKPTGEGTGLGLSLSYDIVTKGHGGVLMAESHEGEGAVFLIRLLNTKSILL